MSNLLTVTLTNGAVTGGTGTASTIDNMPTVLYTGQAATASSLPVVLAPQTTDVANNPTLSTTTAYTSGQIIGGILTFTSILPSIGQNGIIQSITAKFATSANTSSLSVAIFKASPSNGTYADHTSGTWNSADMANLLGIYLLPTPNNKLGSMTIYNVDGVGKAFVGATTSLYALVIAGATTSVATTSDFTLELAVLPG
jgi:hypothetical protein